MKIWSPGLKLADIERLAIGEAYAFHAHNKTKTAEALGISIRTLDQRLAQIDKVKNESTKTFAPTTENHTAEYSHGNLRSAFHPYAEGYEPDRTKSMVAEKVLNKPEEAFGEKPKVKPNGKAQTVKLTHAAPKKK